MNEEMTMPDDAEAKAAAKAAKAEKRRADKLKGKRAEHAHDLDKRSHRELDEAARAPRHALLAARQGRHEEGVALLRSAATTFRAKADEFEAAATSIENEALPPEPEPEPE